MKNASSRGRMANGQPNPIDTHVGSRIRLKRTLLGLSQDKLASQLGLTFQQVQKYERGMNRVSASRLWDISKVLDVDMNFFYLEMDKSTTNNSPRSIKGLTNLHREDETSQNVDIMAKSETITLVKNYYKLSSKVKVRILGLITALATNSKNEMS